MSDLRYSLTLDLAGNLASQARKFGGAMGQFAQQGQRHLGRLRGTMAQLDRGLDALSNRYTAIVTGAGTAATLRFVGNMEERLTYLGIQANKSEQEIAALSKRVYEVAQMPDIRLDPAQLLDAVDKIVEKTGDLDFAAANLRNIGLAARASNAMGADIGALVAEFKKLGIEGEAAVLRAIDTLVSQGKAGAFTLQNLAAQGERAVAAYAGMGYKGQDAVQAMGSLLQMARMGTGSAEQATTAYEAMLRTIVSKGKQLQKAGIVVFDPEKLKQGVEEFRPMPEIIKSIMEKAQGKSTILQPLFGDEGYRAITSALAEYKKTGGFEEAMDKFLEVDGDGAALMGDAARGANTFNAALRSLTTTAQKWADNQLSGPVQWLADAMNSLSADQQDMVANVVGYGGAALGAGLVGRKVWGWGRSLLGKDKKGGSRDGILGGLAGGLMPTPVTVMNWPVGMMSGLGGGPALGPDGKPKKTPPKNRPGQTAAQRGARLLGNAGRLLGRVGIVSALVGGAQAAYALSEGDTDEAVRAGGRGLGGWGGMAAGAAAGAAVGSVVPVVGTAAGGLIGGAIGGIAGSALGEYIGDQVVGAWDDWFGGDKKPAEAKVSGKMEIDVRGPADVRSVRSDNPDFAIEAAAGPLLGGM